MNKEKIRGLISQISKIKVIGKCVAKGVGSLGVKIKESAVTRFIVSPKGTKVLLVIIIIIGATQFAFGILIYGFKSMDKTTRIAAKIVPYPAVMTNQSAITYSQYLSERDYIRHFYKATDQDKNIDFAAIDKEIVNQLVENRLINLEAFLYGVKVPKSAIAETINQITEQNGGEDNVAKVLDDLYGLSIEEFQRLVKLQLLREKVDKEMIAKIEARHILVRVAEDATAEQIEAARVKIEGYKTEITQGLDFAEAAKKYSEDVGSAEAGGLLDPFAKGEMVKEFSDAAFSAKVGEIIGPIKTDFGWHIIKVEKKSGKIEQTFVEWLTDVKKNSLVIKLI